MLANVILSLSQEQKAALAQYKFADSSSWDLNNAVIDKVKQEMRDVPEGAPTVMGLAGDMFSWMNGNSEIDTYFCPGEMHVHRAYSFRHLEGQTYIIRCSYPVNGTRHMVAQQSPSWVWGSRGSGWGCPWLVGCRRPLASNCCELGGLCARLDPLAVDGVD